MTLASNLPSQQDAIAAALALYPSRPFAVSDIGSQTGWLKAAGHDPRNLYVSGPMGLATSVALGLAAALIGWRDGGWRNGNGLWLINKQKRFPGNRDKYKGEAERTNR